VQNTIMYGCYIDAAHAFASKPGVDWDQSDPPFIKGTLYPAGYV